MARKNEGGQQPQRVDQTTEQVDSNTGVEGFEETLDMVNQKNFKLIEASKRLREENLDLRAKIAEFEKNEAANRDSGGKEKTPEASKKTTSTEDAMEQWRKGMEKTPVAPKKKEKTEYEKMSKDEKDQKQGEAMESWIERNGETETEKKEEKEPNARELLAQLTECRTRMIEAERNFRQAQREDRQGTAALERELQRATENYEIARAKWAKKEYEEKIELIGKEFNISREDLRFEEHLQRFIPELWRDIITRERDELARENHDCLEPRRRTWFRRMLEAYNRQPTWRRVLLGTAVVTGAAALGGTMGWAAAATFGATRFVRGLIGAKVGAFTGGLVKSIFGRRVEQYRTNELAAQEASFGARIRRENPTSIDDWRNLIRDYDRYYENTVREVNRRHRNINLYATGAGILAGGAAAYAAGPILDSLGFNRPSVPPQEGGGKNGTPNQQDEKPKIASEEPPKIKKGGGGKISQDNPNRGENPVSHPQNNDPKIPWRNADNPLPTTPEETVANSLDDVRRWTAGKFSTLGPDNLRGLRVRDVLDPKFVGGNVEVGAPGWNELQDRIGLRNEILRITQNKMSLGEVSGAQNMSVLELLRQKL